MKNNRLKDILAHARQRLADRIDADILVAHALNQDRAYLYAHDHEVLEDDIIEQIHQLIKRRLLGEPIAYLLGHKEFYGRRFRVSPDVLIPRPETELLIDQVLALELSPHAKVVDIGTGSGCIGLTLAAERPHWTLCVSDVSPQALAVCQHNRKDLNLTNVVALQGSLFQPWRDQSFDLIVANLPYLSPDDPHLNEGDLRYEPELALVAEDQGQALMANLVQQAPAHLICGGHILLEHGFEQQDIVKQMLIHAGFSDVRGLHDLAGLPRVVMARWL